MNTKLVWRDPPPLMHPGHKREKWEHWVKQLTPLIKHPGRWALVDTADKSSTAATTASNLRRGVVKRPPGNWEFTARSNDQGGGDVYARYLGNGSSK